VQTAYDILSVEVTASDEAIRQAYLLRVRLVHPDRHADADEELKAAAEAEFRRVQNAYDLIRTADRRRSYNARIGRPSEGTGGTSTNTHQSKPASPNQNSRPSGPLCQSCGRGPAEKFKFNSIRGRIIYWEMGTAEGLFCHDCALLVGRDMQSATLTWGWFGIISAVLTPFVAMGNASSLMRANRMLFPNESELRIHSTAVGDRPGPWISTVTVAVAIGILILVAVEGSESKSAAARATPTTLNTTTTLVPRTTTTYAPTYPWEVGNCISLPRADGLIRPVACDVPNIGFIFTQAPSPQSCPQPRTDRYVERDGTTFCIDSRLE
jgi:hypothetical protein